MGTAAAAAADLARTDELAHGEASLAPCLDSLYPVPSADAGMPGLLTSITHTGQNVRSARSACAIDSLAGGLPGSSVGGQDDDAARDRYAQGTSDHYRSRA